MRFSWMRWTVLGLFLSVGMGCSAFGGGGSSLKDDNAKLTAENQQLKARLDQSERQLRSAPDAASYQALQNDRVALESRIKELEAQLHKPGVGQSAADPGIAGIDTTYDRKKGELTVSLPADILYTPGSAELKANSKSTLEKVIVAVKKDFAGKKIRVEGHTDRDPIVRSKDQWIDNLDLSLNRAASVSRFLIERGVDRSLIGTVGWGDAHPKGTKPASRRVEIIVVVG